MGIFLIPVQPEAPAQAMMAHLESGIQHGGKSAGATGFATCYCAKSDPRREKPILSHNHARFGGRHTDATCTRVPKIGDPLRDNSAPCHVFARAARERK